MKLWPRQISLRTLLILCALAPPLIAVGNTFYHWKYCLKCGEWISRDDQEALELDKLIHLIQSTIDPDTWIELPPSTPEFFGKLGTTVAEGG